MSTRAENKIFMFTGKLSMTRSVAQELARRAGGIPGSSVTLKTDFLVVGSKPGSKLGKATHLGVETITEQDFLEMLKEEEEELPVEEWREAGIKIVAEGYFVKGLEALEKRVKETKEREERERWVNLHSIYSFESPYILSHLLKEEPWLMHSLTFEVPPCKNCGAIIPYTTQKDRPYCFNCHGYADAAHHTCILIPHPRLSIYGEGYKICELCEKTILYEKAEFVKRCELQRIRDVCFSAEAFVTIQRGLENSPTFPRLRRTKIRGHLRRELDSAIRLRQRP